MRRLAQLRGDIGDEAVVKDGIVLVVLSGRGHRRRSTANLPLGEGEFGIGVGEQIGGVPRLS